MAKTSKRLTCIGRSIDKFPLAYGALSKEEFDREIDKGIEDIKNGRVFSAESVEEEMCQDYGQDFLFE